MTSILDTPSATTANSLALQGRVAVVTGSTSGIGLAIAHALSQQGAAVMLNGFGEPEDIARTMASFSQPVQHAGADVSDPEQVRQMIQQAVDSFGAVDILVNNAGVQFVSPVEDFPDAQWQRVLNINLSSAFYGIKAALPHMQARGWGRILNIASAHGLVASPNKAAYVAAKHGMLGLTKVVALESAERGITCNAVCPGYVMTPLVASQIEKLASSQGRTAEEVAQAEFLNKHPNRRFVTAEEVGQVCAFLCSPGAASITGGHLSVDGGWTAI